MNQTSSIPLESLSQGTDVCRHCGKLSRPGFASGFCCQGCEAVYHLLHFSGLGKFYELKKEGVCFTPSAPASCSNPQTRFEAWNEIRNSEVEIYVEGIHCSACLWLLEKIPEILPDTVKSCNLDLGKSILHLSLTPQSKVSVVADLLASWGYPPHLIHESKAGARLAEKENRSRLIDLGIAGALAGNIMLMSIPLYSGIGGAFETLFEWFSAGLAIPALFFSGRSLFSNVGSGIRHRHFPIDAPILLALLVAFFFSFHSLLTGKHTLYFDSLSALIFLLLSSRYYLTRLRQSAEMNLGALQFQMSSISVKVGDFLEVCVGDELVFDGVLRSGELWIDASKFTGESELVHLKTGDLVYSGTRIAEVLGSHQLEVLKVGGDTRLGHLLAKIEICRRTRTSVEIQSDRLAKRLLSVVTALALIAFCYFGFLGQLERGIPRILALLIVTCPCALALGTPLVFSLAMKELLDQGVLVKDPNSLDLAAEIKSIHFDKTGTLTEGRLAVVTDLSVLSFSNCEVLKSMVMHSRHPVSRAIFAALKTEGLALIQWKHFEEMAGQGLRCFNQEGAYALLRVSNPSSHLTEVAFSKTKGSETEELLRIRLSDVPRTDTSFVISKLKALGYKVGMLSGDHQPAAEHIAGQIGIDQVRSGLSPECKSDFVKNDLMVGDGFNDALALGRARVSIAIQGGMDAAVQSAQVYCLKPGISGVHDFLNTAKKVRSTLSANFALSTGYNLIAGSLSLGGFMSPIVAAVLMPLSALTVFSYSVWRFKKA